jgi:hypothetical protein
MPSMSSSKYNTLRTCPRLFYWEQVRFLERAREDGARGFGTLFHSGLEEWWKTAGAGLTPWADDALVAALKAIGLKSRHIQTDPYDVAKAEAMMTAYHALYIELEFELVGGGVESFFRVPLRDPHGHEVRGWSLTGKKDALVKLAHLTKPTPVEHKTTGSDIAPGSDYWQRISVDGQISGYIDAARALELDCDAAYYDVARKPDVSPELATPVEKRKMTQGKGCSTCGGSGGGKNGIKQGTGIETIRKGTKRWKAHLAESKYEFGQLEGVEEVQVPCEECKGTGWKDEPRWAAFVRLTDETPLDYKARVIDKLAENPTLYFQQAPVPRTDEQIAEARADLVCATVEIDNYYGHMRRVADRPEHPQARYAFPRNTSTCLNIYGRRCDFLDVCSGSIQDPAQSQLYRIRDRKSAQGAK